MKSSVPREEWRNTFYRHLPPPTVINIHPFTPSHTRSPHHEEGHSVKQFMLLQLMTCRYHKLTSNYLKKKKSSFVYQKQARSFFFFLFSIGGKTHMNTDATAVLLTSSEHFLSSSPINNAKFLCFFLMFH